MVWQLRRGGLRRGSVRQGKAVRAGQVRDWLGFVGYGRHGKEDIWQYISGKNRRDLPPMSG